MLILIAGCTPKCISPPCTNIPCEWHTPLPDDIVVDDSANSFIWWQAFDDCTLNSLIARMTSQNLDLFIAASRILEAREMRKGEKASLFPHIDATAATGGLGYNRKVLNTLLDSDCNHHHNGQRNIGFFEFGFDAEWEIDIFGVTRNKMQALKAKLEASQEEFQNIWISLTAELARNYIELRGQQQQLALTEQEIDSQQEIIVLMHSLNQAGNNNPVQENQAITDLNALKGQKTQIELAINQSIHRLSVLLGLPPGDLFCELQTTASIPCTPSKKPIGVPSELLQRRPDIRKAEREIAAANAMVASAVASLFPRISLTGFIGDIGTFQNSSGFAWLAGPQLLAPIFNSRLIEESVEINKIKMEQAIYEYKHTVLKALEEVENALSSYHFELQKYAFLATAANAQNDSLNLTDDLYRTGSKDYIEVLSTKRAYIQSQKALLQSQITLCLDYIAIYKALGGGWCNDVYN